MIKQKIIEDIVNEIVSALEIAIKSEPKDFDLADIDLVKELWTDYLEKKLCDKDIEKISLAKLKAEELKGAPLSEEELYFFDNADLDYANTLSGKELGMYYRKITLNYHEQRKLD